MTDIDYGALFEVDAGAEETEPADPSEVTQDAAQGAEERESADPAGESDTADTSDDQPPEDAPAEEPPPAEKPEDDARFAAARRRAEEERDIAIAEARRRAEEDAWSGLVERVRALHITDPYTGKPVSTRAELDEYIANQENAQRDSLRRKSGLDEAQFAAAIDALPEVKAARLAKAAAESEARWAREQRARQELADGLREISALDPSVTRLSDLAKTESFPRVMEYVRRGLGVADAYKLANFDTLAQRRAEAAKTAAIAAAGSKAHLRSSRVSGGTGLDSVPADVMREYRELCPGATAAEIQKHYNSYIKR